MPISSPLEGIRVLDLGQVFAGPLLGVYLADFGAEVIRVETKSRASLQRSDGPTTDPGDPRSYNDWGRNKRCASINLENPRGRDLFLRLVAVSDIVFDNFSPRAIRKLSIDYETLRQVNPRVIVASLSAAGQYGPWSDLLTYGPSLTALYGMKSLLGYSGEEAIQEDVADLDPIAATYALIAILAAIRYRERTGKGQFIDLAQGEGGVAMLAEAVMEFSMNGVVMGPTGNRHRMMAPHGIYQASGEDCWISLSIDSDAAWVSLCQAVGKPMMAEDERFRRAYNRLRHQDELDELVATWTREFDAMELTGRLQDAGVASYPVLDVLGAVTDEQLDYRRKQRFGVVPQGLDPAQLFTAPPWLLSASPPNIHSPVKPIDADNDYVFQGLLGLSESEVARAVEIGAIG